MLKTPTKYPVYGDEGDEVVALQHALNRHGAHLKVDGEFGPKTKEAVIVFQKSRLLLADGIPGANTLGALGLDLGDTGTGEKGTAFSRDMIAKTIVDIINKDVDAKLRETEGKNRSKRIDSFNRRVGAAMGAPYCASGAWCAIDDACKALGLKNPVPPTASSQAFRKKSFVPEKYLRKEGSLGKIGDVGVYQQVSDPAHGHLVTVRVNQTAHPSYDTCEYNTDLSGDRDGEGAFRMTRSTKDGSKLLFISFADIPGWIHDHNN